MLLSLHEIIVAAKTLGEDLKASSGVIASLTTLLGTINLLVQTLSKEKSLAF